MNLPTRWLISIFLILSPALCQSQVLIALIFGDKLNTDKLEFGLIGGVGFSNMSNISARYRTGFNLGLYFNIKVNDRLYLHPEAIAKGGYGADHISPYATGNMSLDTLLQSATVERKLQYAGLVLLVQYRLWNRFYGELGPQFMLRFKANDLFKGTAASGDLHYTVQIKDQLTKLDAGMSAGLLYRFLEGKSMALGVRYYYGFVDVMKLEGGSQANRSLQINLSIPVGAGKKNKPAEKQ